MRRRCLETTMAGGIKVAVSAAVGSGPWVWGTGCGRAMRLLLVFSGCLVCGSGTARAASTKGAGAEGFTFRKVGSVPARGQFAEWRGCAGMKKLHCRRMGVGTEGSGPGMAWRSSPEWGGAGSLWRRQEGRPGLGQNRSWGLLCAVSTSWSFLVKRKEKRGSFWAGRAATGTGASHLLSKLGTPSECILFRTQGVGD